jgi:hypothetical protein
MKLKRPPSPAVLTAMAVVLGLCIALAGVYLLAGLPVALIVSGVVVMLGGLVVDV